MTGKVEVEKVGFSFGERKVLDDVSFSISPGERLAVLGRSGAGKTTLLRILAGLEQPASGKATVDGVAGLVFQELALWPHMTVEETLTFVAKGGAAEGRKNARVLAERMGLGTRLDAYPDALSGGEAQRLAIARSLASEPNVLLLDEPFSHLDPTLRWEIGTSLLELVKERSTTLVFVTHQRDEVFELGERLLVLEEGRVREHGALADVLAQPKAVESVELLGLGTVVRGELEAWQNVQTPLGELKVDPEGGKEKGPVAVLVRPDQVHVWSAGEEAEGVPGVVRRNLVVRPDAAQGRHAVIVEVGKVRVRATVGEPVPEWTEVKVSVEGRCDLLEG